MKSRSLKLKRIRAAALGIAVSYSLLSGMPVLAAVPNETLPPDLEFSVKTMSVDVTTSADASSGEGTLTVQVAINDSYEVSSTAVEGCQITVTRVASLDKDTNTFTLDPRYSAQEEAYRAQETDAKASIFDGMNVSQSNELAALLEDADLEGSLTAVTGADGSCQFENLSDGMYLICETGKTGAAARTSTFAPFLWMVPEYESDSASWNYAVTAHPKTTITESETETETNPPKPTETTPPTNPSTTPGTQLSTNPAKTGDENPIGNYVGLALISGIMIIGIVSSRRKEKD